MTAKIFFLFLHFVFNGRGGLFFPLTTFVSHCLCNL